MQIVSFSGYTPPARFDAVSWTLAQIEEAANPAGPWAIIDTVSIGAPDFDPAHPQTRDFTTALGTGPDLWYRVSFLDAAANISEPTNPVQNIETAATGEAACQDWISCDDILDCCDTEIGSNVPLQTFASEAQELLFELSGRRFTGICRRTVRPCPGHCGCWIGLDPLDRYLGISLNGESLIGGAAWFDSSYWFWHGRRRGCRPLSTVKLSGYPVQQIVEVTIDGNIVDPAGYQLKRGRELVRLNDANGHRQHWPGCQDLGQTSGLHTFFVTYLAGLAPPVAGVEAAKQLGCELVKACSLGSAADGDCELPHGTVRLTRQGFTVEAQTLGLFLAQGQTGLAHVDAFLAAYGTRARRPAALWSPDIQGYAQDA